MAETAHHPRATMTPAVLVVIDIDQPEAPRRLRPDDGTVLAFHEWLLEVGVFPLRGTGSSGPGFYHGAFAAEHAEAIRAWLDEHEVPVS